MKLLSMLPAMALATVANTGLVQKLHGKCLDGQLKDGGLVHMWACDPNNHQQQFVYDSKTKMLMNKNKGYDGRRYCLRNPTDGGDVEMWRCDTEDTRQRFFYFTHNQMFKAWHGNYCLDNWLAHENKNGGNVHVHGCGENNIHQKWILDAKNGVVRDQPDTGLIQKINGKCLDGQRKDGGLVHMWDCDSKNVQQQFVYDSKSLLIKSRHAIGGWNYCLRNPSNGGEVEMWRCDSDDDRQKWFYFSHNGVVKAWNGNACLDNWLDHENKNGGNVHVHPCSSNNIHQQWNFDAVSGVIRDQRDSGLIQRINGKCLDGERKDGGKVHMWGCNHKNHQQRFIYDDKTLMLQLREAKDGEQYCLRAPTDIGDVQMWRCDRDDTRQRFFYFRHNNALKAWNGNACLDNYETANGANVKMYHCNGGFAQQWNLDAENGVVLDRPDTGLIKKVKGKCMDGERKDGGKVHMWDCNHKNEQQQFIYDSKTKMIQSRKDVNGRRYCLRNPTNGGDVEMWRCDTEDTRQKWFYFSHNRHIKAWHGNDCLDNWLDHENKNGGNVHVHPCSDNNIHQEWNFDAQQGVVRDQPETALVQKINGKCLDAQYKDAGKVHMWDCDNTIRQQQFVYDSKNLMLQLRHAVAGRKYCLRSPTDGGEVQMWRCDTDDKRQKWFYNTDTHVVKAYTGNFCLDNWMAHENKNGGNVKTWECNQSGSQTWNLDTLNGVVSDQPETGLVQKINGKCLDGERRNGGKVHMWGCDSNNMQQQFVYDQQTKMLRHKHQNNGVYYCLRNPTNGGEVEMWKCDTEDTRQRFFYWTHNHVVKAWHGNYCLDNWLDHENKNGGRVHVHGCSSNNIHQQWYFDVVNTVVADQSDTGLLKNIKGKCVDASQRNTENGLVHMWGCDQNNINQVWEYSSASKQVKNKDGKCLQITDLKNGGDVVMASCQSSKDLNFVQTFYYDENAHQLSAGWANGKKYCLDSNQRDVNGGNVHLWECGNHANQQFFFDHKELRSLNCIGAFDSPWKDDQSQCQLQENGERRKVRFYKVTRKAFFGGNDCPKVDGYKDVGIECTEDVDVEMEVNETKESFTAQKQQAFISALAKQLNLNPEDISIQVGAKPNPRDNSRRLVSAGGLLITVTIKVKPSRATREVERLESKELSNKVAAATGIKPVFKQFKPAHGSLICATCKWDKVQKRVQVTHYINAQKAGEKGMKHRCWHTGDQCKCACQ